MVDGDEQSLAINVTDLEFDISVKLILDEFKVQSPQVQHHRNDWVKEEIRNLTANAQET